MNKSTTKHKKCAQTGATQLEKIRQEMKHDKRGMAQILGVSYSAYQKYVYGTRPVPAKVLADAKAAQIKDRAVMTSIIKNLERDLDRRYPTGIPADA